jgi:hypothetical protein
MSKVKKGAVKGAKAVKVSASDEEDIVLAFMTKVRICLRLICNTLQNAARPVVMKLYL